MDAALATAPGSMLVEAASISINYPQFQPVSCPVNTEAQLAWQGTIKAFTSDNAARNFLRTIEADELIDVSQGTLLCSDDAPHDHHWADPFLVSMDESCRLLTLSFMSPAHPRSYLLSPEFSRSFLSQHPHPRPDLEICLGSKTFTGLCVYSAAEFSFSGRENRMVEYLDQVSIFVARHLIWLRTRRKYQVSEGVKKLVYAPKPRELIIDNEVGLRNASIASIAVQQRYIWDGYWPGKEARAIGRNHLLLNPKGECWCGSGRSYGQCHRPSEEMRYLSNKR